MTVYNRTFFDLNNERGHCVDGAAGLPPGTISDLKVSVPNRTETIQIANLFLQGETVRFLLVAVSPEGTRPVANFVSDSRSQVRIGQPYSLVSMKSGYGGLIVFGEGFRTDCPGTKPLTVSEECLTRFEPSLVPYVGLTCDSVRLMGEVRFAGGDPNRLASDGIDVPEKQFHTARALRLAVVDSGAADSDNPMIALANGINAYYGETGGRGPVYKLFGAMPDATGKVYIRFDEHFHFAAAGTPDTEPSLLALGTDRTVDDICREKNGTEEQDDEEEPEIPCRPSNIQFETIPYE